jgi:flagellar export protein FliJ
MAFRYPLQAILRLRQSLERQEEQKLLAIAAAVARLRNEIEQIEESRMKARRTTLAGLLQAGVAAELQFANLCDEAYARRQSHLQREMQAAEKRRREQLQAYQFSRQRRETLDGLRERQEMVYKLDAARREQQSADEMFLIRSIAQPRDEILPSGGAESAQWPGEITLVSDTF